MIKINLCPIDELENPYWYLPELLTLVIIAVGVFGGVQYYFGTIEKETLALQAETQSKQEAIAQLKPDLERFKDLQKNVEKLQGKLAALKQITVSKISKYKPVIVTEHFQNLRPEGLWFNEVRIGGAEDANSFQIRGAAMDNLLIAEMLTALRSTESADKDESDLRTMVYFTGLELISAEVLEGAQAGFPELKGLPQFEIHGRFGEHGGAPPTPEDKGPKAPSARKAPSAKADSKTF